MPTAVPPIRVVSHRSPEHGVRERNEGQHGGKCRQDHGPRALHGRLDDRVHRPTRSGVTFVEPNAPERRQSDRTWAPVLHP